MIVSDTTPISNFIQLELKDLLQQMFGMITIPEAVALELDKGREFVGNWRVTYGNLIQVVSVKQDPLTDQLLINLHPGEAEALTLAIRQKVQILLCDDMDARRAAIYHGVKVTGTLGILVKAKSAGLLVSITPYLDRLRDEIHFWFTDELYRQMQYLAGDHK